MVNYLTAKNTKSTKENPINHLNPNKLDKVFDCNCKHGAPASSRRVKNRKSSGNTNAKILAGWKPALRDYL